MNRWIALILMFGLVFWGVFIYRMTEKLPNSIPVNENTVSIMSIDDITRLSKKQPLPPKELKNPFSIASIYRPTSKSTKPTNTKEVAKQVKPELSKPDITLDAILPGERPVAILRHKGVTSVVRENQEIWSVTIKSISTESVTIEYVGVLFEIKK